MPSLKTLARQSVHSLGGMQAFRLLNRNGVRILMYHRFGPQTDALAWQCEYIVKHYRPLSLDSYAELQKSGQPIPQNSLAITVDDGYRDFLLYAYPVFRKFEIPCTVYLVSDFLDGKLWLWWNQLEYAFRNSRRDSLTFELDGRAFTVSFNGVEE